MAEVKDGAAGQVEATSYCMKDSWQARNVDDMNQKMGYNNLADLANTAKPPTPVKAAGSNPQLSPKMPGDNRYNYNSNR